MSDSILPGIEEYMKGSIEYCQIKKDQLKTIVDTIDLQGQVIQRMGQTIEKMLETMQIGSGMLDMKIEGCKEKWDNVVVAFNNNYDDLLAEFLRSMQAVGLIIDVDTMFPELPDKKEEN